DMERQERRLHEVRARSHPMKRHILLAAGLGLLAARALRRRSRRWDLAGRSVLVTGGSRGLGLVIARQLLRAGARVAICGRDEATPERARPEPSASDGHGLARGRHV